ncbi:DUF2341 domain-containing protein [Thermococcus henrietii]|uniref:DUF2341 domain-containing protein n=1 Tax=Thermococcus henrietii TaxID=2016361 RepID=UPI000C06A251|nr:DUF2341 domain-containing protein [Thermococcus henrietii]
MKKRIIAVVWVVLVIEAFLLTPYPTVATGYSDTIYEYKYVLPLVYLESLWGADGYHSGIVVFSATPDTKVLIDTNFNGPDASDKVFTLSAGDRLYIGNFPDVSKYQTFQWNKNPLVIYSNKPLYIQGQYSNNDFGDYDDSYMFFGTPIPGTKLIGPDVKMLYITAYSSETDVYINGNYIGHVSPGEVLTENFTTPQTVVVTSTKPVVAMGVSIDPSTRSRSYAFPLMPPMSGKFLIPDSNAQYAYEMNTQEVNERYLILDSNGNIIKNESLPSTPQVFTLQNSEVFVFRTYYYQDPWGDGASRYAMSATAIKPAMNSTLIGWIGKVDNNDVNRELVFYAASNVKIYEDYNGDGTIDNVEMLSGGRIYKFSDRKDNESVLIYVVGNISGEYLDFVGWAGQLEGVQEEGTVPLSKINSLENSGSSESNENSQSMGHTIFFDGFENYTVGSFPSAGGWILDYEGAGSSYQKVVSYPVKTGEKALQLLSAQGCWAAVAEHKFNSNAQIIGFEADVMAQSFGTEGCGGNRTTVIRLAFWNGNLDSWGRYYADVQFAHNGIIYALSSGIEHRLISWKPQKWYHVTVILNRNTNTYSVYINNKLVASNIPVEHTDTNNINAIVLTAGHANTKVFFDNVRVFEINSSASISKQTPILKVVQYLTPEDLSKWKYYRNVIIQDKSGQTLKNFQVLIKLNSTNFDFFHANPDGSDIRIVDENGNFLPYWIEEWNLTSKEAEIWTIVPEIPAYGTVTLKLYYGNPNAQSRSNGDKVFEFFDDFSRDVIINKQKWNLNYSYNSTWTLVNGLLKYTANGNRGYLLTNQYWGRENLMWCTVAKSSNDYQNWVVWYSPPFGGYVSNPGTGYFVDVRAYGYGWSIGESSGNPWQWKNIALGNISNDGSSWYLACIALTPSQVIGYIKNLNTGKSEILTATDQNYTAPRMFGLSSREQPDGATAYFKYAYLRLYAPKDPLVTVGSEHITEEYSQSTTPTTTYTSTATQTSTTTQTPTQTSSSTTTQATSNTQTSTSTLAPVASSAIGAAKTIISQVPSYVNTSQAKTLLEEAQNAYNNGDYKLAKEFAETAQALAVKSYYDALYTKLQEEKAKGVDTSKAGTLLQQAYSAYQDKDYTRALRILAQADLVLEGTSSSSSKYYYYILGALAIVGVSAYAFSRRKSKPAPVSQNDSVEKKPIRTTAPTTGNIVESLQELYTDFELIGQGGFAWVYKARRKKDGKVVALKIPKNIDPVTGKSFLREITHWLHLKHPNIVELYDANVLPIPYLEMEYCDKPLSKLRTPLDVEQATWIIFNIAEGLKYAHKRGVIHRDLKPSNVLLKAGIPKISDWGLSKVMNESKSSTTTTSFTLLYAAPEQLSKSQFGHTDERTDIWALGVIFYELVTGKLPFDGSDLGEITFSIIGKDPIPPSSINPEAKLIEPIIMKMLAKRKEDRYTSVEELQQDLARVLNLSLVESMKKSQDPRAVVFYAGNLALMHLKLGNLNEALKYLLDLQRYTGRMNSDLNWLIDQVKLAMEENVRLGEDALMKADVIIHEIKMGR